MKTFLVILFTAVSMAVLAQDAMVVQLEYFFDSDNGVGNNTLINVTPASDDMFLFTANIGGLSVGYHKIYVRTKDSNGKWSFTARRNVEVFASDKKTSFVSGEYFIDTDPGFGAAMPITVASPDSVILQNFTAATADLPAGYHKLYGRMKDNLGRWSLTFRRNIELYKNDTNYITKAEYFFRTDKGYGTASSVLLSPPATDGTYTFNIPLSDIPTGADTLFVRVLDSSENNWSLTVLKDTRGILPLTLLNSIVAKQGETAQLEWQTTTEVNTAYFDIQRSTDGTHFTTIGKIPAKGNNSAESSYSFADDISTAATGKLYYRLAMVDKDGKLTYSGIKDIYIENVFRCIILPNPITNNNINLSIFSGENAKLELTIYAESGQLIYNEQFSVVSGRLNKTVNVSNLAAGSYIIRITGDTLLHTLKFIKQ